MPVHQIKIKDKINVHNYINVPKYLYLSAFKVVMYISLIVLTSYEVD